MNKIISAMRLARAAITPKNTNILIMLTDQYGNVKQQQEANIITNDGDIFYSESATGETPTNDFNSLYLSTAAWDTAPAKDTTAGDLPNVVPASELNVDATYPKTNDDDADNINAALNTITWRFSYAAADFDAVDMVSGSISIAGQTWGSGTGELLSAFSFTAFSKDSTDTLKIFVNHTLTGV